MKKTISLLLIASLAAAFLSCGGDAGTASDTAQETGGADVQNPAVTETQTTAVVTEAITDAVTEAQEVQTAPAAEGYTCVFDNGITLKLGSPAADALAALGDYSDMMEASSCVHEGFDRVYTYAGLYTVLTSPDAQGKEYVAEISLLSDLVALDAGGAYLMIGSAEADIKAAFGDPVEDAFGVQKYNLDGANVTVTVDGGAVTGFVLTYPVN
ncbi:MAG: hypothetical protein E7604_12505 [Ruminococcaceae bacterium]|nr:hypothetical protein [Oscillospiraceae bacterium]